MNKHILLVMKWLADASSVSQKELEKSKNEANTAPDGAAHDRAHDAVFDACDDVNAADVGYLVDEYFKETGEDKNEYLKELNK
jgi:hypothetical protein